ncbi:MAG TPA: 4Fe-4S binding protein [Coriobacteriia bacterium]
MARATIDTTRCDRSPGCVAARFCPQDAIVPIPGGSYPGANGYRVDEARCTGCLVCRRACPFDAVGLEG